MNQKTAWFMMQRIRAEMSSKHDFLLQGIIEADETSIGGKLKNIGGNKRGKGTDKISVIGAVERGGKVIVQPISKVKGKDILDFMKKTVDPHGSILMTDKFTGYKPMKTWI